MRNAKRILAGAVALVSVCGLFGCGKSGSTEEESSYEQKVEVKDTSDIESIPKGAESELRWFSYFDLNPTKAEPEKRTDLDLFEKKGG